MSHCGWRIASLLAKAWLLCRHLAGGDFVGLSPWNLHIGSGAAIPATWLASHCPSWPWAGPCRTLTSLLPRPCAGHLCPLCLALSWPYCVLCFRPCAGLTAWFPRSWAGLEVLGLWPWAGRTAASCPGLVLALGELCDQDRAQHFEFDSLVIDFLCLAWIATIASAFDYVRWNWICEHSCLGCHNHQGLLHPCVQWRSFRL